MTATNVLIKITMHDNVLHQLQLKMTTMHDNVGNQQRTAASTRSTSGCQSLAFGCTLG